MRSNAWAERMLDAALERSLTSPTIRLCLRADGRPPVGQSRARRASGGPADSPIRAALSRPARVRLSDRVYAAILQCSDGLCCARYSAYVARPERLGPLTCRFCGSALEHVPGEVDEGDRQGETVALESGSLTLLSGPLARR